MTQVPKDNKYFIWIVNFAGIFFGIYFLWLVSGSEFRGLPYTGDLSYLEAEFRKISPPQNAVLSGDIKVLPKTTLHVVSAHFNASLPAVSVIKYYQDTLPQLGWKQEKIVKNNSDIKRVEFCKKDMDAILEFIESRENYSKYYFGVRWENGRLVKTGC